MFAIIKNNSIQMLINNGAAFTYNEIQYPSNWIDLATEQEKANLGIVSVVYETRPDDRFYIVNQLDPVYNTQDNNVVISFSTTPKDFIPTKDLAIFQTNQTAYNILQSTDWIDLRNLRDPSYKPEWMTWRSAIRAEAAAQVSAINACTTIEELAALPNVSWSKDPNAPA